MAKKSRMSVLKRQREARKAEKAALKRERRETKKPGGGEDASEDEMAAYFATEPEAPSAQPDAEEEEAGV